MKTWTPFSLLYVNLKIISKAFASRYKTVLPSIISLEETAYFERRFIFEGVWLISDILSVTNNMQIKSYLATIKLEKAFESLDNSLLISFIKKLYLDKTLLTGSKYFYISKNRVHWAVVLQQRPPPPPPAARFSPVMSTNIRISLQNVLTFRFSPFSTLV